MNGIPSAASIEEAMRRQSPSGTIGARQPWRVPFRQEHLSIRPLPVDIALNRLGEPAVIRLNVADSRVRLLVPVDTLRLVAERLEPLARWERLSPAVKAEVLECLLADVLERIENEIGAPLCIEDVTPLATVAVEANYAFEIRWDELAFVLCGQFQPDMMPGLTRWAGRLPSRRLSAQTAAVCLRRGYVVLTAGEIASLSPGDAIVVEPAVANTAVAVTGERYLAVCARTQEGFTLTEPLLKRPTSPMRHLMTNETLDGELHGLPQPSAVADIPIKLVFEAGRLELPLGELEGLGEGHIFPLDRPLGETVDIVAQGRIIGRGEIVTLDGFAAVRITAITN
ncbi:type III secretion system cytoplasmic ring protein SctQ [Rhizobium sp. TRM95111]|uniref:type III secretion system cytoplasmic ring protein SctQ n=1 Tax=Rhizobium alarense TaxID=2846851 RepID=UPI001F270A46|nr:type III secretion system cytoplasmic ring protein SctQ [Rhizobium alarense]MCF3641595.1 type III secretion system cytoplasmic ring protein SctQ [Rhizobium alarense]